MGLMQRGLRARKRATVSVRLSVFLFLLLLILFVSTPLGAAADVSDSNCPDAADAVTVSSTLVITAVSDLGFERTIARVVVWVSRRGISSIAVALTQIPRGKTVGCRAIRACRATRM